MTEIKPYQLRWTNFGAVFAEIGTEFGERYIIGLDSIEGFDDGTDRFARLKTLVIFACEAARRYRQEVDPNEMKRQADTRFLSEVDDQVKAARLLSRCAIEYPQPTNAAFLSALFEFKEKYGYFPITARDGLSRAIAEIMSLFAAELKKTRDVKPGSWVHRNQVGPLLYRAPIDQRPARPNAAIDGLLFHLVLIFRNFTGTEGDLVYQLGETMPDYGQPKYPIVCDFVNAALETEHTPKNAANRLRKLLKENPGLGLTQWPTNGAELSAQE